VILYFSYRQTIEAYPHGGGSYTVATENLGEGAGLLAAAALMIDYILTAAVGISAGVTALTSAVPSLHPYTLTICLVILGILAVINLRGVKDTGAAFIIPTFLFVATLLVVIGVGAYRAYTGGGHPVPMVPVPPPAVTTVKYLGIWLLLKTFASGCAAMTGVEAVSNGVMAFKEPRAKNAQRTLTIIVATLIVLLFGTAWLAKAYGITAMDPEAHNFQRAEHSDVGRLRAWLVLLHDDGKRVAGDGAEREYGICGLSAAGAGHFPTRLSAARLHPAREKAAVLAWRVCADGLYSDHPDSVWWCDRSLDSAVRHRRCRRRAWWSTG
jgi:hypothetical protein